MVKPAAALALILLVSILPASVAKTFQPTFAYADGAASAYGATEWAWRYDRVAGRLEIYSGGGVYGGADVTVRMGSYYPVNAGTTLPPSYSASVSAAAHVKGHFSCLHGIVGTTEAKLELDLVLEAWTGSSWRVEEREELAEFSCVLFTSVDAWIVDSRSFTFQAGKSYRILLEAHGSQRMAAVGEAYFDFYDHGILDERILLDEIAIPNQKPKPRLDTDESWYVTNLVSGTAVQGYACDYDGRIVEVTVRTDGESDTNTGSSACMQGHLKHTYLLPGTYEAEICGKDDERARACDEGSVRVTLIPSLLAARVEAPRQSDGSSRLAARFEISTEGEPVAARLEALAAEETPAARAIAAPHSREAVVVLDENARSAEVALDGERVWAGPITRTGPAWWEWAPVDLTATG